MKADTSFVVRWTKLSDSRLCGECMSEVRTRRTSLILENFALIGTDEYLLKTLVRALTHSSNFKAPANLKEDCDMKCSNRSQQASARRETIKSLFVSLTPLVHTDTSVSKGVTSSFGSKNIAGWLSNLSS